jgi:hypothetical protein
MAVWARSKISCVFRALDPKVGRVVAVKVLDSNGDDSQSGRFRNEAAAAGNLDHENIVTVHEFGEDNAIQYLVMEYLEGQDLRKVLKEEQLGKRAPLTMHYAHRSGVLHRDVKPALRHLVVRVFTTKCSPAGMPSRPGICTRKCTKWLMRIHPSQLLSSVR